MIENSIPTIKCYIDDVVQNCSLTNQDAESESNFEDIFLHGGCFKQNVLMKPLHLCHQQFFQKEIEQMAMSLCSPGKLKVSDSLYDEETSTKKILQELVQKFSKQTISCDFQFPLLNVSEDFERSLYPEKLESNDFQQIESSIGIDEFLKKETQGTFIFCDLLFRSFCCMFLIYMFACFTVMLEEGRLARQSKQIFTGTKMKFSLTSMVFYLPGKHNRGMILLSTIPIYSHIETFILFQ